MVGKGSQLPHELSVGSVAGGKEGSETKCRFIIIELSTSKK